MKKLENYLDLHMHTSYSLDGEYSPEKLVELCGAAGVRIMSISDHNSAKANKAAALEAKRAGIVYINGIELDCRFKNADLHVLGYGIDDGTVDFERFERAFKEQHVQVSKKSLEFVRSLGFKIEAQELREHAG
ncbi:MAG: PHP domain-containing protein, partial [Oscillospiraceae bacterium]